MEQRADLDKSEFLRGEELMNDNYIYGSLVSLVCSILAVFFSQGGIAKYQLFIRLSKTKGAWHKVRATTVILMLIIGPYGIWLFGCSREFIGFMLLITYLLAMSITDLRNRQIPDDATIFFTVLFLIFNIWSLNMYIILSGFIGIVAGSLLPYLAYTFKKESIGFGDVKLIGCIGLVSGFPEVIYITTRGLVVCGVYCIIMLCFKKASFKTQLPLAPFILIGALL